MYPAALLALQAYLAIGACFGGYILSRTWWDHWKTALPGAVIAMLIVPLWLPAIIIVGLLLWWAWWSNTRRVTRRNAKFDGRHRRTLDAVKDKHGIDDAAVTARIIEDIKESGRG